MEISWRHNLLRGVKAAGYEGYGQACAATRSDVKMQGGVYRGNILHPNGSAAGADEHTKLEFI